MVKNIIKIIVAIVSITFLVGSLTSCAGSKNGKRAYECPNKM